jgi:hypothetical protein
MAAGDMRERAKHIRDVKLQQVTSDRMTVRALHALALLIVLTGLATFRQPLWPAPWQDEGFTLQGAINLSQHGLYAMRSAEGFRVLDQPLIADGPGIVLPLAVVFDVAGIGYEQARAVAALFMDVDTELWTKFDSI